VKVEIQLYVYNFGTFSISTIHIKYYEIFEEMIQFIIRSNVDHRFNVDQQNCLNHKKQRTLITMSCYNCLVSNELLWASSTLDPSLSGNGARNQSVSVSAESGENVHPVDFRKFCR